MNGGKRSGAGRPKGSINKRSFEAQQLCEKLQCDPLEILIHFAKGDWEALGYGSPEKTRMVNDTVVIEPTISPELRNASARAACEYVYPKRKAIEQSFSDDAITEIERTIITRKV